MRIRLVITFSWAVYVALCIVGGAQLRAEERTAAHAPTISDEFPISSEPMALMAPVTLGRTTYSFAVDTGATLSAFDTSLAGAVGAPLREKTMRTAADDIRITEFAMPAASLGRLTSPSNAKATVIDLRAMRQALGEPFDGVIGMDFFRDRILQLDFDAEKMRFLTAVPVDAGSRHRFSPGASRIGTPLLSIMLTEDEEADFIIDTGMNATLTIEAELFERLNAAGLIRSIYSTNLSSAAGKSSRAQGRLETFTVGSFTQKNLVVGSSVKSNLIGLGYLRRFIVTFDFAHRTMYLKPSRYYGENEAWDLSGLHIWKVDGRVIVDRIDPGSPAAEQDFRPQDVIESIDGRPVAELPLLKLRSMLREEGRSVILTVNRGGKSRSATLELREFRTDRQANREPSRQR